MSGYILLCCRSTAWGKLIRCTALAADESNYIDRVEWGLSCTSTYTTLTRTFTVTHMVFQQPYFGDGPYAFIPIETTLTLTLEAPWSLLYVNFVHMGVYTWYDAPTNDYSMHTNQPYFNANDTQMEQICIICTSVFTSLCAQENGTHCTQPNRFRGK